MISMISTLLRTNNTSQMDYYNNLQLVSLFPILLAFGLISTPLLEKSYLKIN